MKSNIIRWMQATKFVERSDLPLLCDAVFDAPCRVYESYSGLGERINEMQAASDLQTRADGILERNRHLAGFAIWYEDTGPNPVIEEISLNPKACDGHTFRERVSGWGVIQLQCQSTEGRGVETRIAVNTEKRAEKWEQVYPQLGAAVAWNWPVVERHARRLIRVLRKIAMPET